jgi:hypothetical protein
MKSTIMCASSTGAQHSPELPRWPITTARMFDPRLDGEGSESSEPELLALDSLEYIP